MAGALEKLIRNVEAQTTNQGVSYDDFKRRYKNDRVNFVKDCIQWYDGQGPCFYQEDIFRDLDEGVDRLSWRGPRGARKTSTCALIIIHFALTHDGNARRDWKVGLTASVGRQLTEFLWPEIHKWISRLRWDKIGRPPFKEGTELMAEKLKLSTGHVYSFTSNDPDKVEGCHADDVLIIFDESKAVPEASRKAVMGGITGAGADTHQKAIVIAVSTPGAPTGWFYDIHRGADRFASWKAIHITQEMCVKAKSLSVEGLKELERECGGAETSLYKQQGLGEFAADDELGLLPLAWIERAMERGIELRHSGQSLGYMTSAGVDVSDGGKDKSIVAPCHGLHVGDLIQLKSAGRDGDSVSRMMSEVGQVVNILDENDMANPVAVVDNNGAGAGFTARLKEIAEQKHKNWSVQGFMAQQKVDKRIALPDKIKAKDLRSAGYLLLAHLLDPDKGHDISLPDDKELKLELSVIQRLPEDSEGRIKIEPKDMIRKRIGRSTDRADAVMQGLTAQRVAVNKRKIKVLSED